MKLIDHLTIKSRLNVCVEQFDSQDAASLILETYLNLHAGKIGQHWLWAAVERVAAGEDEGAVLRDYGYEPSPWHSDDQWVCHCCGRRQKGPGTACELLECENCSAAMVKE